MLDRIIEFKKDEKVVAVKNITANEWPFIDSTSQRNFFPEVLLLEAAAQTAIVLYKLSLQDQQTTKERFVLGKIVAEFQNTSCVGDQLEVSVFARKSFNKKGYVDANISSGTKIDICTAQIFYSTITLT